MGDWGSSRCLKQSSLALDRKGHELFPSTPTLATFAPAAPAPLPPILLQIHILLASPTQSPKLDFPKKSPKLSSRAKCTSIWPGIPRHLAYRSRIVSSGHLLASPTRSARPHARSSTQQALSNNLERRAGAKGVKRVERAGQGGRT